MPKETIKVCCIEWEDACIVGRDQVGKDSKLLNLMNGFSCGVIVKEDKKMIALAQDYFQDDNPNAEPYRTVTTYPKSGIKRIHRMRFKQRK